MFAYIFVAIIYVQTSCDTDWKMNTSKFIAT